MEKRTYRNIPIRDSHMHIWRELPLAETVAFHKWVLDRFDYETVAIMSIIWEPKDPPTRAHMQNLKSMYLKKELAPRAYAYAGLHFDGLTPEDDGEYFLQQAKYYRACGYDGMKMFYPVGVYTAGFPHLHLSDPRYEKYFAYLEQEQIPLTIHLGGPEVCFADIEQVPVSQRKWHNKNWTVHLHDVLRDFEKVLDKFPKLNVTIAHFAFITWHMDWAERWFEKYENLALDLTPSLFMYFDFQENPKEWTEFFLKYADRIIYGTDIGSNTLDLERYEPDALTHVVRGFFEETEPIHEFEEVFYPMPLPDDVLKKIYRDNFVRKCGETPRPVNYALMAKELELEAATPGHSQLDLENLEIMRKAFLQEP